MISKMAKDNLILAIYGLCALAIVYLAFNLIPFLIGPWESYQIYNSFAEINRPDIRMTIQVGANTAGHYGDNYGLINLWVFIVRKLDLTLSLFNIRFLSIIFGFVSLFLFYRITVRWFGRHIALMITALMAVNETFLLFEHYLLPQMFTFAAMLFCLERFQVVYGEDEKHHYLANITLGFAASLCAMNYLLSRLFLIFIFMLQIKMIFTHKNHFKISKETMKINFQKLVIMLISYLVFLGIFNIKNVPYSFKKVFIFSDLGEYATGTSSFLNNTAYNFPFLIKHTFIEIPFVKASLPFFILGDAKYHLITWPVFTLVMIGLFIALKNLKKFKNALTLYIFGMMLFIMNMSYVYDVYPDGSRNTTLSSFRTFYLLLPIFLLIGIFWKSLSQALQKKFKNYHPVYDLCLIFLPLFIVGLYSNILNFRGLHNFYNAQQFDFKSDAPKKQLSEEEITNNIGMLQRMTETQEGIFYKNQVYIRKLADKIDEQVNLTPQNESKKFVFHLPLEKYTPAYYNVCCSLNVKPYLKTFLSIYLFDKGIKNTYIDNQNRYRFKNPQVFISTNDTEFNQIKKDFPDITIGSILN